MRIEPYNTELNPYKATHTCSAFGTMQMSSSFYFINSQQETFLDIFSHGASFFKSGRHLSNIPGIGCSYSSDYTF